MRNDKNLFRKAQRDYDQEVCFQKFLFGANGISIIKPFFLRNHIINCLMQNRLLGSTFPLGLGFKFNITVLDRFIKVRQR